MADIVLKFRGQEYRIPDSKAFQAGAELEEVITLSELHSYAASPKFFKLAMAMGVLLRFAGCKVSDRDVKAEIDASITKAAAGGVDAESAKEVFAVSAISQLVAVLFDGAPEGDGGETGEGSAS